MIDKIWTKIIINEGEIFTQKTGKQFSYEVMGNTIKLSTTNQNIAKSQFEKALAFVPLEKPSVINHLRAPSYIYAILMDQRIKINDW